MPCLPLFPGDPIIPLSPLFPFLPLRPRAPLCPLGPGGPGGPGEFDVHVTPLEGERCDLNSDKSLLIVSALLLISVPFLVESI